MESTVIQLPVSSLEIAMTREVTSGLLISVSPLETKYSLLIPSSTCSMGLSWVIQGHVYWASQSLQAIHLYLELPSWRGSIPSMTWTTSELDWPIQSRTS
jgi:hypothetical protein